MMKRPRLSRSFCVSMLALAGLLALTYFPVKRIRAANAGATILPSTGKPLVNLKTAQNLKVTYTGPAAAALQAGTATPTALAAADFNADGAIDVVAGYSTANSGVIALFRGNPDAYAPTDPTLYAKALQGKVPPTFQSKAPTFALPESPDLLATGDFNRDGNQDVLVASRGGNLYFLAGDGHGNLLAPQIVPLTGQVMAMAVTGDGHVAVSMESPSGSQLVILAPTPQGLTAGASYTLPAPGNSVAWGNLGGGADVAVGAGSNVVMVYNALKANAQTETVPLPFQVKGLTLGDFIWDQDARQEISILADDGSIHILQHGTLNTAPLTAAQLPGRRAAMIAQSRLPSNPTALGAWSVARQLPYAGSVPAGAVSPSAFNSPQLAASSTRDLMVLDAGQSQLHILDTSGKTASPSADIVFSGTPVAALAMPQKINSDRDIVVLTSSQSAPMLVTSGASLTLNVNTTADIDVVDACTNSSVTTPPSTLSLREAVCIANNNAPDTTTINLPPGTYDLTSLETGELQVGPGIAYSLTINGTGTSSNTIIQQTDGRDRIIEQDPYFSGNVNITIENVTVQLGNCTTGTDCSDGGGFLLGGGPDGAPDNLTLTNVVVNDNTAGYSALGENGGAMDLSAAGTYTFTNCTFSNNTAVYHGAPQDGGGVGGAFEATNNASSGNLTVTNCTFTNNTAQNGGGGAIYSVMGTGDTTTISGSTFSGNSALDDAADDDAFGGAIVSDGDMTISNSLISGNTSADGASFGTGLWTDNDSPFGVTATNNFWGCNGGPGASGCNTVATTGTGSLTTNPWLVLSVSANPAQVLPGGTSLLTANLTENSNNVGGFSVPNGTVAVFNGGSLGIATPSSTFNNGTASSTFTAGSTAGNATATATVDNATADANINILVTVTVTTSPANLSVTVDGTTYTAPQTFDWVVGSSHTLNTTSPQNVSGGTEQVWSSWSQGGTQSQTVTAPSSNTIYTANFTAGYQLTMLASPSADGSVTPTSGQYFALGAIIPVTATANAGFAFSNWTSTGGTFDSTTSASTNFHMPAAPATVIGNFATIVVATPTTTSVSSNNDPSFTTAPGNSVTFTATVTSNSTVNEGMITFSDTANNFTCSGGNTVPVSNGQATCTTSFSTEGSQNITATYNGTVNFQTSNGFITQTVNNHTVVNGNQFCNQGPITIPSTAGAATPYPSNIFVTDLSGNVGAVTVNLNNISSSNIQQTDFLLVGPTGAEIIPFASVGDGSAVSGVNITLDDTASGLIPVGSPLTTGSYKPTSITGSTSLVFPAPAPTVVAADYAATDGAATLTSQFGGTSPNGTWALYATDNSGNGASTIGSGWCVNITPAVAPAITSANNVSFTPNTFGTFTVTTTGSPVARLSETGALPSGVTFADNGNGTATLSGTATVAGTFPLIITAANGAGTNATQNFTLTVESAPVITSANNTTFMVGTAGSFTVTTTAFPVASLTETGALPSGVSFVDNHNGTGTLSGTHSASGTFNITFTASNGVGANAVQNFTLTVAHIATTSTISSNMNPSSYGQTVTFTGTVTPVPPDNETLTFKQLMNNGTEIVLGTGTLNEGIATFSISTLAIGKDEIKVTYPGDYTLARSHSNPVAQVVDKDATITALSSNLSPSTYGQAVTFTATVTSSGSGVPTGTVTFKNGATALGTATLNEGTATLTTSKLPAGVLTINAAYNGNAQLGESSGAFSQTVNQATTATSLVSSRNPSNPGQAVKFTATVTSSTTTSTGTVTFMDGTTLLGTGTLAGGKASYITSTLSAGSHDITAVYPGTANVTGSTSPAVVQTVN
jgi:predicted outer membrane repeat protein